MYMYISKWCSCAQMSRHERFPTSYQSHVHHLVTILTQHVVQKSTSKRNEAANANSSLANFLKVPSTPVNSHLKISTRCFIWQVIFSARFHVHGSRLCVQADFAVSWSVRLVRHKSINTCTRVLLFPSFNSQTITATFIVSHCVAQALQELRLEFVRIVCEHEHYVPLNLPFLKQTSKHFKGWILSEMFGLLIDVNQFPSTYFTFTHTNLETLTL